MLYLHFQAMKYLLYVLNPLLVGVAIYSLIYYPHKRYDKAFSNRITSILTINNAFVRFMSVVVTIIINFYPADVFFQNFDIFFRSVDHIVINVTVFFAMALSARECFEMH